MSVDETETPTSPLEHLFVGLELKRLGIKLVSLAPRFIGDFEKGLSLIEFFYGKILDADSFFPFFQNSYFIFYEHTGRLVSSGLIDDKDKKNDDITLEEEKWTKQNTKGFVN